MKDYSLLTGDGAEFLRPEWITLIIHPKQVTLYDLKLKTKRNYILLAKKGSELPLETTIDLTTSKDQETVKAQFFAGNCVKLMNNKEIGELIFKNLPMLPSSYSKLQLTTTINDFGDLHLKLKDVIGGKEEQLTIDGSYFMIKGAEAENLELRCNAENVPGKLIEDLKQDLIDQVKKINYNLELLPIQPKLLKEVQVKIHAADRLIESDYAPAKEYENAFRETDNCWNKVLEKIKGKKRVPKIQ